MKQITWPLAAACAVAMGSVSTVAAQQRTASPEVQAVRTLIQAVGDGMQAGNFASLDTLFAASRGVHIIEGAGVNHGWAEYRDDHLRPELDAFTDLVYRWYAIEPVVRGDAAWASFRYDLQAQTERGTIDVEGRGTIVLTRSDGRWLVVHLHTSGRPRG